jgi:hypothetical protein
VAENRWMPAQDAPSGAKPGAVGFHLRHSGIQSGSHEEFGG